MSGLNLTETQAEAARFGVPLPQGPALWSPSSLVAHRSSSAGRPEKGRHSKESPPGADAQVENGQKPACPGQWHTSPSAAPAESICSGGHSGSSGGMGLPVLQSFGSSLAPGPGASDADCSKGRAGKYRDPARAQEQRPQKVGARVEYETPDEFLREATEAEVPGAPRVPASVADFADASAAFNKDSGLAGGLVSAGTVPPARGGLSAIPSQVRQVRNGTGIFQATQRSSSRMSGAPVVHTRFAGLETEASSRGVPRAQGSHDFSLFSPPLSHPRGASFLSSEEATGSDVALRQHKQEFWAFQDDGADDMERRGEGEGDGEEKEGEDGGEVGNRSELQARPRKPRKSRAKEAKVRPRFTAQQTQVLEKAFHEDRNLSTQRKQHIADHLGVQARQVSIWFQNRRARWRYSQAGKKAEDMSERFAEANQRSSRLMRALEELQQSHMSVLKQNAELRSQLAAIAGTLKRKASNQALASQESKRCRGTWHQEGRSAQVLAGPTEVSDGPRDSPGHSQSTAGGGRAKGAPETLCGREGRSSHSSKGSTRRVPLAASDVAGALFQCARDANLGSPSSTRSPTDLGSQHQQGDTRGSSRQDSARSLRRRGEWGEGWGPAGEPGAGGAPQGQHSRGPAQKRSSWHTSESSPGVTLPRVAGGASTAAGLADSPGAKGSPEHVPASPHQMPEACPAPGAPGAPHAAAAQGAYLEQGAFLDPESFIGTPDDELWEIPAPTVACASDVPPSRATDRPGVASSTSGARASAALPWDHATTGDGPAPHEHRGPSGGRRHAPGAQGQQALSAGCGLPESGGHQGRDAVGSPGVAYRSRGALRTASKEQSALPLPAACGAHLLGPRAIPSARERSIPGPPAEANGLAPGGTGAEEHAPRAQSEKGSLSSGAGEEGDDDVILLGAGASVCLRQGLGSPGSTSSSPAPLPATEYITGAQFLPPAHHRPAPSSPRPASTGSRAEGSMELQPVHDGQVPASQCKQASLGRAVPGRHAPWCLPAQGSSFLPVGDPSLAQQGHAPDTVEQEVSSQGVLRPQASPLAVPLTEARQTEGGADPPSPGPAGPAAAARTLGASPCAGRQGALLGQQAVSYGAEWGSAEMQLAEQCEPQEQALQSPSQPLPKDLQEAVQVEEEASLGQRLREFLGGSSSEEGSSGAAVAGQGDVLSGWDRTEAGQGSRGQSAGWRAEGDQEQGGGQAHSCVPHADSTAAVHTHGPALAAPTAAAVQLGQSILPPLRASATLRLGSLLFELPPQQLHECLASPGIPSGTSERDEQIDSPVPQVQQTEQKDCPDALHQSQGSQWDDSCDLRVRGVRTPSPTVITFLSEGPEKADSPSHFLRSSHSPAPSMARFAPGHQMNPEAGMGALHGDGRMEAERLGCGVGAREVGHLEGVPSVSVPGVGLPFDYLLPQGQTAMVTGMGTQATSFECEELQGVLSPGPFAAGESAHSFSSTKALFASVEEQSSKRLHSPTYSKDSARQLVFL